MRHNLSPLATDLGEIQRKGGIFGIAIKSTDAIASCAQLCEGRAVSLTGGHLIGFLVSWGRDFDVSCGLDVGNFASGCRWADLGVALFHQSLLTNFNQPAHIKQMKEEIRNFDFVMCQYS